MAARLQRLSAIMGRDFADNALPIDARARRLPAHGLCRPADPQSRAMPSRSFCSSTAARCATGCCSARCAAPIRISWRATAIRWWRCFSKRRAADVDVNVHPAKAESPLPRFRPGARADRRRPAARAGRGRPSRLDDRGASRALALRRGRARRRSRPARAWTRIDAVSVIGLAPRQQPLYATPFDGSGQRAASWRGSTRRPLTVRIGRSGGAPTRYPLGCGAGAGARHLYRRADRRRHRHRRPARRARAPGLRAHEGGAGRRRRGAPDRCCCPKWSSSTTQPSACCARAAELAELGLLVESFGPGALVVREMPALLGEVDVHGLVRDLADELAEYDQHLSLKERLDDVCCDHGLPWLVRAGRRLNVDEMNALLRQMEVDAPLRPVQSWPADLCRTEARRYRAPVRTALMARTVGQDTSVVGGSGSRRPRVGLALGSGSARGWAHIGVIEALGEAGIVPDVVCGTSIGALVGAAFVSGRLEALKERVQDIGWRDIARLLDVHLSGGGLVDGRRIVALLHELGIDMPIEDCAKPFAAVATDLETGREIWLREGPIDRAVRASISIPGIFSPSSIDDKWLVDGGLVNPVPVSTCRALGADVVIAVNLNDDIIMRFNGNAPRLNSCAGGGWQFTGVSAPPARPASPAAAPGSRCHRAAAAGRRSGGARLFRGPDQFPQHHAEPDHPLATGRRSTACNAGSAPAQHQAAGIQPRAGCDCRRPRLRRRGAGAVASTAVRPTAFTAW